MVCVSFTVRTICPDPMPSITRNSQSSRAQRREEIRDRLRTAAEELMSAEESYTELSVERIVREAGISRATFYVYFEDKGDLLRALAEDFIERILVAAAAWWQLPADATKGDLRAAMRAIFDAYLPHKVVMAAVVEVASYDAGLRQLFGDLLDRTIVAVGNHIATGQSEGYVEPDLDPQRTAAWLTWMAERGLYQLVAPANAAAVERLLDAITDITWNTLYAATR
jgi:AcrR family transcriptional regulator